MKKISFLLFGLLTLCTLSFISTGPPKEEHKKRRKSSFLRLEVEQNIDDFEVDSSNNEQN